MLNKMFVISQKLGTFLTTLMLLPVAQANDIGGDCRDILRNHDFFLFTHTALQHATTRFFSFHAHGSATRLQTCCSRAGRILSVFYQLQSQTAANVFFEVCYHSTLFFSDPAAAGLAAGAVKHRLVTQLLVS